MPGWAIAILVCGIILLLVLAVVVWIVATYNSLVRLRNNSEEAFSTMDVYLKKRYDLIPNLVETVKGYAKHEKETLEKVMQARYSCMSSSDENERAKNENVLTGTLKTLFSVAENYPQLKANENFIEIQKTLKSLEDEIANSRKYYNGCVRLFNTKTETFPSNLIAKRFKFEKKVLFEIDVEQKETPKVKF